MSKIETKHWTIFHIVTRHQLVPSVKKRDKNASIQVRGAEFITTMQKREVLKYFSAI